MGYLEFDKTKLVNLEYSLSREYILANDTGTYSSSTIIGCNTRKYHGLLVCPVEALGGEKHVLLSGLDVTVVQRENEFNLGIHKYQGDNYSPKGHKYVEHFHHGKSVYTLFRVGGVELEKEVLLVEKQEQVLVRFTLREAHSPTLLKFRPFLAFRNMHQLSHSNLYVNTKYTEIQNGIISRLYEGFPDLHMQFSKSSEFVPVPDWYYNIEYIEELKRGYDYKEDLFAPGYFEIPIKKGESIVFSASTKEVNAQGLKQKFVSEWNKTPEKKNVRESLKVAANQFVQKKGDKTGIIAGFPWFGVWGRDTFISLPGLTFSVGDVKTGREVIQTMVNRMKGGLFPNMGDEENPAFNSVDAPLWFFWTLQQWEKYEKDLNIWEQYGKTINEILEAYKNGTGFNIMMNPDGLIIAGEEGKALTWMDAIACGKPVTPRMGMPVEINALWYNAISASLGWAKQVKDKAFEKEWTGIRDRVKESFVHTFWDENKGYLADVVQGMNKDFAMRPNQIIAVSLDHSPLEDDMKKSILDKVGSELLTTKGLRTLAPKNPNYQGIYYGDQDQRDASYHQGTVWPWLLEHFAMAYLKVYKKAAVNEMKKWLDGFEEDMLSHGIGTISEIYDGDPPHMPKGAISQAWSVASLLRIMEMLDNQVE